LEAEEWGGHSAVQQFFIAVPASLYTVVFPIWKLVLEILILGKLKKIVLNSEVLVRVS